MTKGYQALMLVHVTSRPVFKCTIPKRVTGEGMPEKSTEKMTAQGQSDPWPTPSWAAQGSWGGLKDLGASRQGRDSFCPWLYSICLVDANTDMG